MAQHEAFLRTSTALVGITSAMVLSGINIGTSLLFMPHLTALPIDTSAKIFDKLFHDGAKAVVPLAAASILSFTYLAYDTVPKRSEFAGAAGLVVATLLWTRVVVMPVNDRLIAIARGNAEARIGGGSRVAGGGRSEVEALLGSWKWMNYVRGFAALGAGLLALGAVL